MAVKSSKLSARRRGQNSAAGVNAAGDPDPTKNVIALNEAGVDRQDDLRDAFEKYVNIRLDCVNEVERLRAEHAKELGVAESKRLDAIRQVDVTAVRTEAERALVAIQTLAAQTATDREKLRTDVAATAQTIAKQTSDTVGQLIERIAALEKSSYEGKGKEAVSDPMLSQMVAELKALRMDQTLATGRGMGIEKVIGLIAGSGGLAALLGYLAAHFTK